MGRWQTVDCEIVSALAFGVQEGVGRDEGAANGKLLRAPLDTACCRDSCGLGCGLFRDFFARRIDDNGPGVVKSNIPKTAWRIAPVELALEIQTVTRRVVALPKCIAARDQLCVANMPCAARHAADAVSQHGSKNTTGNTPQSKDSRDSPAPRLPTTSFVNTVYRSESS